MAGGLGLKLQLLSHYSLRLGARCPVHDQARDENPASREGNPLKSWRESRRRWYWRAVAFLFPPFAFMLFEQGSLRGSPPALLFQSRLLGGIRYNGLALHRRSGSCSRASRRLLFHAHRVEQFFKSLRIIAPEIDILKRAQSKRNLAFTMENRDDFFLFIQGERDFSHYIGGIDGGGGHNHQHAAAGA